MIVRLRGRVCSHLDCTLSGWLGSCEPSFLPSPPPSCVCASSPHPAAPGPACVPRRAPGTSRDFTVDAEAGTAAWSRGLIAHLVLSWLARQPVGGALHTTPRAEGLQGLPGIPEGWEAGARVPAAVLAPPGLDLECKGFRGRGAPVRVALVPTNTESKSKFSPTWEFSPLLPVLVVVQWLSRVCLCDPMDSAHQTSLPFTISQCVCESRSVVSNSLWPRGLYSPGILQASCSLLQGIFPIQGLNRGLLHCRRILYQLSHQGSPSPGVCSNSYPLSRCCHPIISFSESRPLFLLPSIFPSIRVFSNEPALHIRWPKYWNFSFSISPSNEYSGLISFRIDWFDLFAVSPRDS